jgi:hypothetical protein
MTERRLVTLTIILPWIVVPSRWREMKYQYIGALGAVAAIKHVSPKDDHGCFASVLLHKHCRCTPAFRTSD